MEKLCVPYPVVVEGKYDKIKLSSIIDADILVTDGFGIFKDSEKIALIRKIAENGPLIILTDSDGGGKVIRNLFNSVLPASKLIHLYIPQIEGKEKRKEKRSKSGILGVEGISADTLREIFKPFSSENGTAAKTGRKGDITKTDFFMLGLSGTENSSVTRKFLAEKIGLPSDISPNAFITAINILYSRQEFLDILKKLLPAKQIPKNKC